MDSERGPESVQWEVEGVVTDAHPAQKSIAETVGRSIGGRKQAICRSGEDPSKITGEMA